MSNLTVLGFDWDSILVEGVTAGAWAQSHDCYLGFRNAAGNFGYIAYDFVRSGSISIITFLNGAYESDAGVEVTTPANTGVPEPASSVLLGLGLLGFAASRRKSMKWKAIF